MSGKGEDGSPYPNCEGEDGYYSEITEVTDALGVTVAPRVPGPPVAETIPGVSAFPLHGTTVNGTVDPNGLPTTYHFEYGGDLGYGNSTASQSAGSGWQPTPVSGTLTGLKGLSGYHFRLVASNSAGTSYGVDQVFSTPDWRPTIAIDPATSTTKSAVLNARINPQGSATTYYIEWGESGVLGSKVPASPASIGSGTSDVSVSQEISGLTAEREYHYRVVATSPEGTTYSPEKLVWTKAQTPVPKLSFGSSGSGNGQLKGPSGVAVDGSGNVWVADTENNRIEKFSPEGAYLSKFGSLGSGNGQFNKPTDLTVAPNGNLWVVDSGNSRIQQLTPSGEFVSKFGSYGAANNQFIKPFGIASSPNGNLWITDVGASNLKEFQATGSFIRIGGNNFSEPKGLAVDNSGYVWVADSGNDRIQVISPFTGEYAFQFGIQGSADGQFSEPSDVAIRGSGTILVVDTGNNRLQQFGSNTQWLGKYGTSGAGSGQLSHPQSIALAPGGLEYIADTANNRVQKWQQTGDYESRWHSENLGGVLTSDPEICSWGSSHIEVFGRGTDNALWHRYWNGSSWSNWESLGGNIASAPGCVSWGANRLDVVARATDGSVLQWAWNGSSWGSANLGGSIYGDPDIASWGPNRLDIFGRASDGSIAHKAWTGASWSSWENLGGANAIVSGVGAVGSNGDRIDAVGRAANGSVFHLYFYGGWYTANQGGSIKGDPDVTSWGQGNYNLWARGASDDMLNTKYWTGSAWSAWESTKQGPLGSAPGAISFEPGRFDVVTLDANGSVRHWWWR